MSCYDLKRYTHLHYFHLVCVLLLTFCIVFYFYVSYTLFWVLRSIEIPFLVSLLPVSLFSPVCSFYLLFFCPSPLSCISFSLDWFPWVKRKYCKGCGVFWTANRGKGRKFSRKCVTTNIHCSRNRIRKHRRREMEKEWSREKNRKVNWGLLRDG